MKSGRHGFEIVGSSSDADYTTSGSECGEANCYQKSSIPCHPTVCCTINNSYVNSINIDPSKNIVTSTVTDSVSPSVRNFIAKFSHLSDNGGSPSSIASSPGKDVCIRPLAPELLPPIGVFWDIENCQVPKGKSAVAVAQAVRAKFLSGYREAEFIVVCDVRKEHSTIIDELNDAQVNLIHVGSTSKNAADEKLRQSMRRFADTHATAALTSETGPPCIVLITGDINFAADIIDLRHRKKLRVILVHNDVASESLLLTASDTYHFYSLMEGLPYRGEVKAGMWPVWLEVDNLPDYCDAKRIKAKLKVLASNCGGRVTHVRPPKAVIRFPSHYHALRAHRRLDGECVFGQEISVGPPVFPESPAHRGYFLSQAPVYSSNSVWPSTNGAVPLRPLVYTSRNCSGFSANYGSAGYMVDASGTDQYRRNLATLYSLQQSSMPYPPTVRNVAPPVGFQTQTASCLLPNPHSSAFSRHQKDETPCQTEFQPISSASNRGSTSPPSQEHVELNITNLDQQISNTEMKQLLHSLFSQHVTVINICLYLQGDGNVAANITVPTQQCAQMAIAKLQRAKIGQKRITIAYSNSGNGNGDMTTLKRQVTSLLQDVPGGRVPLIRFLEMFEARYGTGVSISELHRLKDLVTVSLDSSGRTLSLNIKHRHSPSFHQEVAIYCVKHFHMGDSAGWAEKELPPLPNIMVPLKKFIDNIVKLIGSHKNALPLASVPHCYAAECGEFLSGNGVPLEHLVTCCPSRVELSQNSEGVRYLRWSQTNGTSTTSGGAPSRSPTPPLPPTLMSMLNTFSREIVDLLKSHPGCQLPFHKLIPAYHHHFRKQCRVSSYGFIRLIELLEAVPSVVQILGEGEGRIVTLTHQAQMKRFCFDLSTIIRSQSSRSVSLTSLPHLYNQIIGVPLDPIKFGVCFINDLIEELNSFGGGIRATELHSGETILTLRQRNSVSRSSSGPSSSGTPSPVQADISAFISETEENDWRGLVVVPIESEVKRLLGESLVHQLISLPGGRATLTSLMMKYPDKLNSLIPTPQAAANLNPSAITVDSDSNLCLTPIYQQIKKLHEVVGENPGGGMTLTALKEKLATRGVDLFGHTSLASLISAAGRPVLALRGKEPRLVVHIIREQPPNTSDLNFFSNIPESPVEDNGEHPNLISPPQWSTPNAKSWNLEVPMPTMQAPGSVHLQKSGILTPLRTAPDPSLLPRPDLPALEGQQTISSSKKRRLKLAAQFAFPM